jgi:hypothetical protein
VLKTGDALKTPLTGSTSAIQLSQDIAGSRCILRAEIGGDARRSRFSRLRKRSFLRLQFPSAAEAAKRFAALTARLEAAPLQSKH